jgi:hypothetical protein
VISTGSDQCFHKGEEVLNCYGKYSNGYLLAWYGFCYQNNKYDKVKIRVKFPNTEEGYLFFRYLKYLLPKLFFEEEEFVILIFPLKNNLLNEDLIKYATFYFFYECDISEKYFAYTFDQDFERQIVENIISLLTMTKEKLCQFTSLEEDHNIYEMIKNDISKSRLKYSLIYRISQKNILEKHIKVYQIILKILKSNRGNKFDISGVDISMKKIVLQYFRLKKQECVS